MGVEVTGFDEIQKQLEKMTTIDGLYDFCGDDIVETYMESIKEEYPDLNEEQYRNVEQQVRDNLSKGNEEFSIEL